MTWSVEMADFSDFMVVSLPANMVEQPEGSMETESTCVTADASLDKHPVTACESNMKSCFPNFPNGLEGNITTF